MEIKRHPILSAEQARGAAFEDAVQKVRRHIADTQVEVVSPDGAFTIVLDGDGTVAEATLDEDVTDEEFFGQYSGENALGDMITEMLTDGYKKVDQSIDTQIEAEFGPVRQGH